MGKKKKNRTIISDTDTNVQSKLSKAIELESRLSSLVTTPTSETQASVLRIQLCEAFSDVLLTDVNIAARKDLAGRMWRSCFYGRIGELRTRIAKEKSRLKKTKKHEKETFVLKHKSSIEELKKSLRTFLHESVVLYDYLVIKYRCMLLSTYKSEASIIDEEEEELNCTSVNAGVVPTLFRLYIHLGDLHRYLSNFEFAESSYMKASSLAPGKGNPYNQLAVVAQLKDSTGDHPLPAISLYWYCRSLLAVHDAFKTSKSNLERLFLLNSEWIRKNVQDSTKIDIDTSGMNREQARAVKSSASRKFLSMFVDFHGLMFCFGSSRQGRNSAFNQVSQRISMLTELLSSLLTESAFSDALLVKMCCINAFSVWNSLHSSKSCLDIVFATMIITLNYGIQLANHLDISVRRLSIKERTDKITIIRLFTPFLCLCEFISYIVRENKIILDIDGYNDDLIHYYKSYENSMKLFWKNVAHSANIIQNSPVLSLLFRDDQLVTDASTSKYVIPYDYKNLRGYAPFVNFIKSHLCKENNESVYLSPEDAITALDIDPVFESQNHTETTSYSKGSHYTSKCPGNSVTEIKYKLARFWGFVRQHLTADHVKVSRDHNNTLFLIQNDGGDISSVSNVNLWKESKKIFDKDVNVDIIDTLCEDQVNLDNDSARIGVDEYVDVIVYKSSASGSNLLVPGSLFTSRDNMLMNKCDITTENSSKNIKSMKIKHDIVQTCTPSERSPTLLSPSSFLSTSSINPWTTSENSEFIVSCSDKRSCFKNEVNIKMSSQTGTTLVRPPPGFQHTSLLSKDIKSENVSDKNGIICNNVKCFADVSDKSFNSSYNEKLLHELKQPSQCDKFSRNTLSSILPLVKPFPPPGFYSENADKNKSNNLSQSLHDSISHLTPISVSSLAYNSNDQLSPQTKNTFSSPMPLLGYNNIISSSPKQHSRFSFGRSENISTSSANNFAYCQKNDNISHNIDSSNSNKGKIDNHNPWHAFGCDDLFDLRSLGVFSSNDCLVSSNDEQLIMKNSICHQNKYMIPKIQLKSNELTSHYTQVIDNKLDAQNSCSEQNCHQSLYTQNPYTGS